MKGKFITIEGIDCCGKSTQIEMLKKRFEESNKPVWFTTEPTDGVIGKMIRKDYLSGKVDLSDKVVLDSLFVTDRLEHITAVNGIKYHMVDGDNVICDRYILSGIAYMAVNLMSTHGYDIDFAISKAINHNKMAGDLLMPNINIILDLTPEEAAKRLESRNELEIYEKLDFQKNVYIAIHKAVNILKYFYNDSIFVYIDANDTPEHINEKIWNRICEIID